MDLYLDYPIPLSTPAWKVTGEMSAQFLRGTVPPAPFHPNVLHAVKFTQGLQQASTIGDSREPDTFIPWLLFRYITALDAKHR
jgi:hypothetical protein